MKNVTATANTTAKAFKWDEKNTEVAIAAYQEKLAVDQQTANSDAFLLQLAQTVGAPSARSVRQKLASQKVYIKSDAPKASATGGSRQKKAILADLIASKIAEKDQTLGDSVQDVFASLENAGRPALLALIAFLNGRPMGNEDLEG